ncbi:MAG: phosphatidate cytidylyltransferase [Magnetococcales bacterium]|nr:phosphatidate cytidylyltransferase [Magnetococcales bacterium]
MNAPLLIRTLSALLLAPPLLFMLLFGSTFHLFLLLVPVATVLIYEWYRMREPFVWRRFVPLTFGVWSVLWAGMPGMGPAVQTATPGMVPVGGLPVFVVCTLLLLVFFAEGLLRHRPGMTVLDDVGWRFLGVLYCALPLVLLLEVHRAERGGWLICFLLLTIWATDVGAYFVGRRWGSRKLAPHISPGKTVAGFWGGMALASVVGGVMAHVVSLPYSWGEAILLAALLSVVGQLGDLAESLLKREAGVKDSGQLIPGHGGMLDRLDSLLFATPVYYLFLWSTTLVPAKGLVTLVG